MSRILFHTKRFLAIFLLLFGISLHAQVNETDSLALVALYNATDGDNWTNNTNWLVPETTVDTWYGVMVSSGNVIEVNLGSNNLVGTIPPELGNFTNLPFLYLDNNQLSGSIPPELENLTSLFELNIAFNDLTGLPDLTSLVNLIFFDVSQNFFSPEDITLNASVITDNTGQRIPPATVPTSDSLALVALYNATDGDNWTNNTNWLTGPVDTWYGVTVSEGSVIEVDLSESALSLGDGNNLVGSIPTAFGGLINLQVLYLQDNDITLADPVENLTSLIYLDLSRNDLTAIPENIGNLTSLESLWIRGNSNALTIPTSIGSLSSILNIDIAASGVSSIPVEMGNLTTLINLDLNFNNISDIPTELAALTSLTSLGLRANNLTGPLRTDIFSGMSSLQSINIAINNLTSIPSDIDQITNLVSLLISDNQLAGEVPASLLNLSSFQTLVINNNELTGLPDFSLMENLAPFDVSDNRFTFEDLEPNESKISLNTGQKPFGVPQMQSISVGEALTLDILPGSGANDAYQWQKDGADIPGATNSLLDIPSAQLSDAGVYVLKVTNSLFPGLEIFSETITVSVSEPINESDSLALVALYNSTDGPNWTNNTNWLTGTVDTWYGVTVSGGRVIELLLRESGEGLLNGNNLVGTIPPDLGNLSELRFLYLSGNQLSGSIPPELGNLANLEVLYFDFNELTGLIPSQLGNLSNLRDLRLYANQLSGSIPPEISNASGLEFLLLFQNQLSGTVPPVLGNLENLKSLMLFDNQLSGSIPPDLGNLSNLTTLDLSTNQLSGPIPSEIGSLINLGQLNLSENSLSGEVPLSIQDLTSLDNFQIQDNELTGLPDLSLSVIAPSVFDVSGNQFTFEDLEPNRSKITQNTGQKPFGTPKTTALTSGETLTLNILPGAGANDAYQWYKDGSPIPGATSSTYSILNATAGDFGEYYLEVTNALFEDLILISNPITIVEGILVTGNLTANETWMTGNTYVLNGQVFVEPGVTLTIEPGVIVKGVPGVVASASYLVVARGATINAQGTASAPIIFTSTDDLIQPGQLVSPNLSENDKARWGGLLLFGNAPISVPGESVTEAQFEAITGPLGIYGGTDDSDNSGTLEYVSIRHGGTNIGEELEISSLILAGVGSATTINNIEVVAGANDGIELFGGSVNVTNALVWNSGDDALDTDQDYQGTVDNFITITPEGSALELDGPEGPDARGGGFHTFTNGSVKAGPSINSLVDWDANTNAGVSNTYFFGIEPGYISGIQSYLGDGSASSGNWQTTLPGEAFLADIFTGGSDAITTVVEEGQNTVGANTSVFADWTWAANVGVLVDFGVDPPIPLSPLEVDSLTLVDLYNSTDGANWTNNTNWLTGTIDTWFGVSVLNDRVTEVALSSNNLDGTIPPAIGDFDSLTLLHLNDNNLFGSVPVEIGNLTELQFLQLNQNQLSGSFPFELTFLTNLQSLRLNENFFTGSVPFDIGNLTLLQTLVIGNNELNGQLPTSLGNLTALTELQVSNNFFQDSIPAEITSITGLQSLSIDGNDFTHLPDLTGLTSLTTFNISNNRFSFEDIEPNVSIITQNDGQQIFGEIEVVFANPGDDAQLSPVLPTTTGNESYQWQFNGVDIGGANATFLEVLGITEADYGEYRLYITSSIATLDTIYVSPIYLQEGTGFSGSITADVTWTGIIGLDGPTYVEPGVTLTIEPGTIVKAVPGDQQFASYLVISRGASINAAGTASDPIIFTSVRDEIQLGEVVSPNLTEFDAGLWGGLIVLGDAPISDDELGFNGEDGEEIFEGLTDPYNVFGGSNATDNSGVLQYISIRHGGVNIGDGNEINGLSLAGVGSGTTVDHIEIVANQDDGLEFFGGTVNVSNVVILNSGDDSMDTDMEYIGTVSNFVVLTPQGGSAFELDGPEGNVPNFPGSVHTFTNGSVKAGSFVDHLVDWDDNTNAALTNIYFTGLDPAYPPQGFSPIESFGGDLSGNSSNWEATLSGEAFLADIFTGGSDAITTVVEEGENTVGANASVFADWTWAANVGALVDFGVDIPSLSAREIDSLALVALYQSTNGPSWTNQTGWEKIIDFGDQLPLEQWYGVSVADDRVISLTLGANNLDGSIPFELGDLTGLESLELFNNSLYGQIPSSFENLINLQQFDVSNNFLSGDLSAEIGSLTGLVELGLSNNGFSGLIPGTLANLENLSSLEISSNDFSGLPDLSSLTNLTTFNVSDNRFTFEDLEPNISVITQNDGQRLFGQFEVKYFNTTADFVGTTLEFLVGDFGSGANDTYQWFRDGFVVPGANDPTLELLDVYDFGEYTLQIQNENFPGITLFSESIQLRQAVFVSSNIVTDQTWTKDNIYILDGRVFVEPGVTLTIEPGTIIKATEGYTANSREMFIAGEFNGFGGDPMTLIGDNLWAVTNLEVFGVWKFKNDFNWQDTDWSDTDCDGIAETNFGPDTDCGQNGTFDITFNEETLEYQFLPAGTLDIPTPEVSFLAVSRGATLNAQGTAAEPIIFTSIRDDIEQGQQVGFSLYDFDRGLWGGLLVLGNAPISAQDDSDVDVTEAQIEGIPEENTLGRYGGTDATDNSGILQYISIRHSGVNIGLGNQINGLTLAGVGSGTLIDNIEVSAGNDDGIEWFGGTVNATNLLIYNSGDDALDTDQSYNGTVDNFLILNPGDAALELDGPEGSFITSGSLFTNGTIDINFSGGKLIDFDNNTDASLSNLYFYDYESQTVTGYAGYAENLNGFGISTIETTIPFGTVADFFPDGADQFVTEVNRLENTVGADASGFFWTYAFNRGALTDFDIQVPKTTASIADSAALVAIYNATGGETWTNSEGWLQEGTFVEDWFGVTVGPTGRVEELVLGEFPDGNNLFGELPAEIGDLTGLKRLQLDANRLEGAIPPELGNLTELVDLNISNNNFTGIIPPELGNLSNLEVILIGGNFQLEGGIPEEIYNLTNLKTFWFAFGNLGGTISPSIGNLVNLEEIVLESGGYEGELPSEVASLEKLRRITIQQNNLTGIPDLSGLPNLSTFNVSDNQLDFADLEPNVGVTGIIYSPQSALSPDTAISTNAGAPINLSIPEVGGSANVIQWFRDEVPIDGANTNSLTVAAADAGIYRAQVTNDLVPGLSINSGFFNIQENVFNTSFDFIDPIFTIADATDGNPETGDSFTMSENLGDINQDGIDDFGILLNDRLNIYFGGSYKEASDLSINAPTGFRFSELRSGDFNGDNVSDVLVTPLSSDDQNLASVEIYFGGASFDTEVDVSIPRENIYAVDASETWGSVNNIGDINNDGADDIIVLVSGKSEVYILFGGATISQAPVILTDFTSSVSGVSVSEDLFSFGYRSKAVGDINGDGLNDFAIADISRTVTADENSSGIVLVYYGNTTGVFTAPSVTLTVPVDILSSEFSFFGINLEAGDFNGDGVNDIMAIPGFFSDSSQIVSEGREGLFIYYGGPSFDNTADKSLKIPASPFGVTSQFYLSRLLASFITIPDLDNNGTDEFIVTSFDGSNAILIESDGDIVESEMPSSVLRSPNQELSMAIQNNFINRQYSAAVGDFDGNGKTEILLSQFEETATPIHVFEVGGIIPPTISVDTLVTSAFRPSLTGKVSDPTATIEIELLGKTYDAVNNADSTWTLEAGIVDSLTNGTYDVIARATNAAGVGTDTTSNELVIDQNPPSVTVNKLYTNNRSPELSGTVSDVSAIVTVEVNSKVYQATNNQDSTWTLVTGTINPPLEDGFYEVLVVGENDFGSATDESTDELFIDATAPVVFVDNIGTSIVSPEVTGFIDDLSVEIVVAVEGRGEYIPTINESDSTWIIPEGTIAPDLSEEDSPFIVTATATDSLLNIGQGSGEVIITSSIIALQPSRITTNAFRANWSTLPDAANYRLEVSTNNSSFDDNIIFTKDTLAAGYTVKGLQFETEYFYRVTFTNTAGDEPSVSNITSVETLISPETVADFEALEAIYAATEGEGWSDQGNWLSTRKQDWAFITLQNERVVAIEIPGNELMGTFPYQQALDKLRTINVANNFLNNIEDLSQYPSLTILNVANNRLEFDDLEPVAGIENLTASPQNPGLTFEEATSGLDPFGRQVAIEVRFQTDTTLTVSTPGDANSYTWKRNGAIIQENDPGFIIQDSVLVISSINYNNMGEISAEVTNALVADLTLKVDSQLVYAVADFSVNVFDNANNEVTDPIDAALLSTTQVSQGFDSLEVKTGSSNPVVFKDVVLGNYLVYAGSNEELYVPTYFAEESEVFLWEEADTILFRNDDGIELIMTTKPRDLTEEDGEGLVKGEIFEDFEDEDGRVSERRRAARRKCGLRRRTSSGRTEQEVFELIAYGETNDNGEFEYGFLPQGVYRFFVEYPGIPLDQSSFVQFEVGEAGIDQSEFRLTAEITDDGIVVEGRAIIVGFVNYFKNLAVYPNPAVDDLNITYRYLRSNDVTVQLLDMAGTIKWEKDLSHGYDGDIKVDIATFPEGVYFLYFFDRENPESNMMTYKIIKRKEK